MTPTSLGWVDGAADTLREFVSMLRYNGFRRKTCFSWSGSSSFKESRKMPTQRLYWPHFSILVEQSFPLVWHSAIERSWEDKRAALTFLELSSCQSLLRAFFVVWDVCRLLNDNYLLAFIWLFQKVQSVTYYWNLIWFLLPGVLSFFCWFLWASC